MARPAPTTPARSSARWTARRGRIETALAGSIAVTVLVGAGGLLARPGLEDLQLARPLAAPLACLLGLMATALTVMVERARLAPTSAPRAGRLFAWSSAPLLLTEPLLSSATETDPDAPWVRTASWALFCFALCVASYLVIRRPPPPSWRAATPVITRLGIGAVIACLLLPHVGRSESLVLGPERSLELPSQLLAPAAGETSERIDPTEWVVAPGRVGCSREYRPRVCLVCPARSDRCVLRPDPQRSAGWAVSVPAADRLTLRSAGGDRWVAHEGVVTHRLHHTDAGWTLEPARAAEVLRHTPPPWTWIGWCVLAFAASLFLRRPTVRGKACLERTDVHEGHADALGVVHVHGHSARPRAPSGTPPGPVLVFGLGPDVADYRHVERPDVQIVAGTRASLQADHARIADMRQLTADVLAWFAFAPFFGQLLFLFIGAPGGS